MPFASALPDLPLAAPGLCLLTDPAIVWLHLLSDVAIGLAYLSIPIVLLVVLLRRRDLAYPWLVGLFAAFILACGATHLMHAFAMFQPAPLAEGLLKALTAAISVAVAITLWPVLPRLLALRSPAALEREVEERRAAELRARESEARMAAFIANLAEAIFVVRVAQDGTLTLETVNPAFERMLGLRADAVLDVSAEQALPPVLQSAALPHWRRAVAEGETLEYEITADLPTGRRSWQTVLVPMRGADGRVERLLGSARDVTTTRRLQANLMQSARLATVGTMCAGLAHEASQPLNTALLWLRRIRAVAEPLPAGQKAGLERAAAVVEEQLRRAGDLVARMRALAGDETAQPERFDATKPIAAALRVAASQYATDGVSVTLHGAADELPANGSATRLEQAVLQMLANARDAVLERRRAEPAAIGNIELTLRRDGGRIIVDVCDTGTGLDERVRELIFDPFFTTKEPGRGAGLGLPFAAGVARAMGGGMDAWNLPGGGACFRMEIAAADRTPSDAAALGIAAA
ncbi:MAG TPA: PAS domain-containing protein [Falsiroseomonas sp.]|jgi:PAS domain S-box-containing protein|nr:PAS domain-containing protein [Falsiroseomonas sp.]